MHKLTKALFGTLAGLCMVTAHAGYTSLPPPAGVSGGAGAFLYRAQATNAWAAGKVSDLIRVAGTPGSVPVGFRVSAARVGSYAASFLFRNPLGLTVAAAAMLASDSIQWDGSQWKKSTVDPNAVQSDGYKYQAFRDSPSEVGQAWFSTASQACAAFAASGRHPNITITGCTFNPNWAYGMTYTYVVNGTTYNDSGNLRRTTDSTCPAGWWKSGTTCTQTSPNQVTTLTEEMFVPQVAPKVLPDNAPYILPDGTPIPVDDPVINPSEDAQPVPRPFFIPDGEPRAVPNPLYDPTTNPSVPPLIWERPGTNVVPAPTPTDPWRVDLQPRVLVAPDKTTVSDPNINTQPQTNRAPTASETKVCGMPDTPACKIDETGTPPEVENDSQTSSDSILQQIKTCTDNLSSCLPSFPSVNWSFALPSTCAPISLGTAFSDVAPSLGAIDICPFQSVFHDIMSMLWAAAGLFASVSLLFRSSEA